MLAILAHSVGNPLGIEKAERVYRLKGFEADLAVLFGAGLADPNYATADGVQFIVAGDDLDELPALEPEAPTEAESLR